MSGVLLLRGEGSGGPPGAVPEHQRDPELAAVLGGDDELELGDPPRRAVAAGLQQLPGRQRHGRDDQEVLARRLGHGRCPPVVRSGVCWGASTVGRGAGYGTGRVAPPWWRGY